MAHAVRRAASDDAATLKALVVAWATPMAGKTAALKSLNDKALRGFNNEVLGWSLVHYKRSNEYLQDPKA